MSIRIAWIIARQELRIALRNRWVVAYALIFAVLTAAISYFGLTTIEFTGFQGFERTSISLLNMVLYIVPLGAMLMAVQSFTPEGGATDQLFTEPVTRGEVVLGKVVGLSLANMIATTFGFGFSGAMIVRAVGTEGLGAYLTIVGFTSLISIVFVSVAALLSVLGQRSLRAYASVVVTWFVAVLLYDLLVIGISFLLPETSANRLAYYSAFVNPVDSARIGSLLSISGKEVFGRAGAMLVRSLGGEFAAVWALVGALIVWSIGPALLSAKILNKQDI